MSFFLIMITSFSLLKDIRRVFEYHGAEHKTVFTWEAGLPLTVENARPQPRQHPRCGTSFLMVVMLVSIILFSVVAFNALIYNMAVRIALIPVVAGLSYEIIRLSAKKEGGLSSSRAPASGSKTSRRRSPTTCSSKSQSSRSRNP